MSEQQNSYRQIIKATTLFGGVQIFKVIISIIRAKIIAILLGPAGMGIAGLLTATTSLISNFTSMGLSISSVKDISISNSTGNVYRIAIAIGVLRRWLWVTGILGLIITAVFSPYWSQLTFGNGNYTLAFVWISITLLINQLSSGQLALLQGMRKLKELAKANLNGNFWGLVVSIPLYYIWRIDAIVPTLIISSIVSLIFSWYYSKKIKTIPLRISNKRTWAEGKRMIIMGFMISFSGLVTVGASYILRIFINNNGGLQEVGYYNAGFAIIFTYVGFVLNAMGTDYFPKLAAVSNNNEQCKKIINQQTEIITFILAPILITLIVFINKVILILYSVEFLSINSLIIWAALGMLFRAPAWAIAYILLVKGISKIFIISELLVNGYMLLFNIIGYKLYGLEGLGISFLITYIIFLIQIYIIANKLFEFTFSKSFLYAFTFQCILAFGSCLAIYFFEYKYSIIISMGIILTSFVYSIKRLNEKLGLAEYLSKFKNKN